MDNFRVIYRILRYLEKALDYDEPNMDCISAKALNHKRFRWDNPPVVDEKTGRRCHPGKDYQCRCCALPVFNIKTVDLPVTKGGDGRG